MTTASAPARRPMLGWVLLGMAVTALLLRAPITGVPPVLEAIRAALDLSAATAGSLSSLPLICFGLFSFVCPFLAARFGLEPTLWVGLSCMVAGIALRLVPSAPFLFAGTLLLGCGIAIGNVITPALVRHWTPERIALVMGWYSVMLQLSGAAGSGASAAGIGAGWSWPLVLGMWLLPAGLAWLLWSWVSVRLHRRHDRPHRTRQPSRLGVVVRRPLVWAITLTMGGQSLTYYTMLTWVPGILRERGMSEAGAGLVLTLFSFVGLPGALLVSRMVDPRHPIRNVGVVYAVFVLGLVVIQVSPGVPGAVAGALISGTMTGLMISSALTFISRQPEPVDVPPVSAFAQGLGYLLAAAGPVAVGALLQRTGGYTVALVALTAWTGLVGAVAVLVAVRQSRQLLDG